jgi:hypothetical protein
MAMPGDEKESLQDLQRPGDKEGSYGNGRKRRGRTL